MERYYFANAKSYAVSVIRPSYMEAVYDLIFFGVLADSDENRGFLLTEGPATTHQFCFWRDFYLLAL